MAMLQRVSAKLGPLPNAEFVVDTSDGYADIQAPIFVIAKFPQSAGGILYPDFSSFAWPESECPSERVGSHVWHEVVQNIASESPPWTQKTDQLFWRGQVRQLQCIEGKFCLCSLLWKVPTRL